ncbi:DNA ligase 6 [Pelomyxa schiedti]|nr:DNA ligase 6 [Pelomyxa schiedti]
MVGCFIVDGFRYRDERCKAYLLSHFHSDHYCGLTKSWSVGPIYCSQVTASLLVHHMHIDQSHVHGVPVGGTITIGGCSVSLLDANHCPGSVMFLVHDSNGDWHLHTGDFRFCKEMRGYSCLSTVKLSSVYLDTTFCDPQYNFPLQDSTISQVVNIIKRDIHNSVLFLIGTYSIGKERILLKVAESCATKIYVTTDKYNILTHLALDMSIFTTDPSQSNVHVVPMNSVNFYKLYQLANFFKGHYKRIVGFQPTGWAVSGHYNKLTTKKSGICTIYGVPYSEHCSYAELQQFIKWLQPTKVIPTVNCDTKTQIESTLCNLFRRNTLAPVAVDSHQSDIQTFFSNFSATEPFCAVSEDPPSIGRHSTSTTTTSSLNKVSPSPCQLSDVTTSAKPFDQTRDSATHCSTTTTHTNIVALPCSNTTEDESSFISDSDTPDPTDDQQFDAVVDLISVDDIDDPNTDAPPSNTTASSTATTPPVPIGNATSVQSPPKPRMETSRSTQMPSTPKPSPDTSSRVLTTCGENIDSTAALMLACEQIDISSASSQSSATLRAIHEQQWLWEQAKRGKKVVPVTPAQKRTPPLHGAISPPTPPVPSTPTTPSPLPLQSAAASNNIRGSPQSPSFSGGANTTTSTSKSHHQNKTLPSDPELKPPSQKKYKARGTKTPPPPSSKTQTTLTSFFRKST